MGTRALIHVYDNVLEGEGHGPLLLTIYRQFDGYPEGLGRDIHEAVGGLRITNGNAGAGTANGMGCLAAQLVTKLKGNCIGNVYIMPPGAKDVWEEFVYEVRGRIGETPTITVSSCLYGWTKNLSAAMQEEDGARC